MNPSGSVNPNGEYAEANGLTGNSNLRQNGMMRPSWAALPSTTCTDAASLTLPALPNGTNHWAAITGLEQHQRPGFIILPRQKQFASLSYSKIFAHIHFNCLVRRVRKYLTMTTQLPRRLTRDEVRPVCLYKDLLATSATKILRILPSLPTCCKFSRVVFVRAAVV